MNVHLVISGRVQGVGFRAGAKQKAAEYNLNGWVRNKSNGTVELETEGPEDQLNMYIDDLKAGFNPFIHVEHVTKHEDKDEKGYKRFIIK